MIEMDVDHPPPPAAQQGGGSSGSRRQPPQQSSSRYTKVEAVDAAASISVGLANNECTAEDMDDGGSASSKRVSISHFSPLFFTIKINAQWP
jgi:hypothetical protein